MKKIFIMYKKLLTITKILPSVILFLSSIDASADSPVTSTSFYSAYNEISQIYVAEKEGILNYELASYLSSNVTIDK